MDLFALYVVTEENFFGENGTEKKEGWLRNAKYPQYAMKLSDDINDAHIVRRKHTAFKYKTSIERLDDTAKVYVHEIELTSRGAVNE